MGKRNTFLAVSFEDVLLGFRGNDLDLIGMESPIAGADFVLDVVWRCFPFTHYTKDTFSYLKHVSESVWRLK